MISHGGFQIKPCFCLNLNGKLQKAKKLDEPVWRLPVNTDYLLRVSHNDFYLFHPELG
jgi:leucyl aminopeptidase